MSWGSARRGGRRTVATVIALVTAGCLAVAASGTGTTYAAFSDFKDLNNNHVGAATVALGIPGPSVGPDLEYLGLLPGVAKTDSFDVNYHGTIPGDIALELRADGGSPYCDSAADGSWTAKPSGQVQIDLGSGWVDYCSLLGPDVSVPVQAAVAPGTGFSVQISVRLSADTGYHYSELTDTDVLTVTARQASATSGGFTDFAPGTITIGTGKILPTIPERCGTLADYPGGVIYGTEGPDHIEGGNQGQIIFGLGGDDVLVGGNAKDCLVGGPGADQLWGNNGKDAVEGGEGDDILIGGNGSDQLYGGDGDDVCYGGNGPDDIDCEVTPGGEGPEPPAAPTSTSSTTSTSTASTTSTMPQFGTTAGTTGPTAPPDGTETQDETTTTSVPEDTTPPVEEEQPPAEEPADSTS